MNELKKITQEELNEVIRLHKLWLESDRKEGKCADLRNTDLCNADLRNANLYKADLCYANLRNADLCYANLCYANLRNANLCYANLCNTDLCNTDLCYADLCNTDLSNSFINYNDAKLIIKKIFQISNIGSRNDTTVFCILEDNDIFVRCGCFSGMIDEFECRVKEVHKSTKYEQEYLCAIELAKSKAN